MDFYHLNILQDGLGTSMDKMTSFNYWWFVFDVMAAMLEVQHKGICY